MNKLIAVPAFAIAFGAIASNDTHAAVALTRPVHVQAVTPDSVTIVWHTQDPLDAVVEFGRTLDYGRTAESKTLLQMHAITLHRLESGVQYYYRVRSGGEILCQGPDYFFRTLPDKRTTRLRFLAFGDSGKGTAAQFSLVPAMKAARPDFMVHTGDVIYNSGEAKDFDPKYFVPYADLLRNTPVWLSLGNHDYATLSGQPYLDAFWLPRNNPAQNERYYSFNYGQAHFAILDSNGAIDSTAMRWLDRDLAEATTLWKFAVFHHPPYSCGLHGSDVYVRNRFAPILERHGVDIVFTGHDHDFQRSHPLRAGSVVDGSNPASYRNPDGVIYVVTGGGAASRATSSSCAFTARAIAATHFTQIDIDGAILDLNAVDATGQVLDSIRIDKTPETSAGDSTAAAALLPNAPNPFNPSTLLRYELSLPSPVRLEIFDLAGRRVRSLVHAEQPIGQHRVLWDGRDAIGARVASGIYMVRLQTDATTVSRKILLAK